MTNRKQDEGTTNEETIRRLCEDAPVTVFLAEPITQRPITNPRPGETQDEVDQRQAYLDKVTGWRP